MAKETIKYFKNNPLPPEIINSLNKFDEQKIDEETLYNLALVYQHPERTEKILETITKYKEHQKNYLEIQQKVIKILKNFDKIFSNSLLAEKFAVTIEEDKKLRQQKLKETKQRIKALLNFFKPDTRTTNIKKVIFVPTDPLYEKNAGRSFSISPNEWLIISHIDNIDNQDHEFSHGIINPIIEKLLQKLTNKQKEKIIKLANKKLKHDYGKNCFSLLSEEFIRTYINLFRHGETPKTYKDFCQQISRFTKEQFQQGWQNNEIFRKRCKELKINNIDDFKNKAGDYFKRFEENRLRNLIFNFYKEYENRPNKKENFEQFVLSNFPLKIKE